MLFLSSPRGVGIASTIELSVVIGTTSVPLLSLLRFGGFGINESQPTPFSYPPLAFTLLDREPIKLAFLSELPLIPHFSQ